MIKNFLQRSNKQIRQVGLRSFMVCLCLALAGVSAWGQETMEIRTADDLYAFAKAVKTNPSLNAILMEDIVVNKSILKEDGQPQILPPDGPGSYPDYYDIIKWDYSYAPDLGSGGIGKYNGTFDGNGKTISGLYMLSSPFIETLDGGVIKNLGIVDSYMHFQYIGDVGIICGKNKGGKIINCYTSATIKVLKYIGTSEVAGFRMGAICGTNEGGLIKNCYNTALIEYNRSIYEGRYYIGGICGALTEKGSITQCYNEGKINITTQGGDAGKMPFYSVGGVLGYITSSEINETQSLISECYNKGDITIQGGISKNNAFINLGGVVGFDYWAVGLFDLQITSANMKGCYNTGDLTVKDLNCDDAYYAIGGISGATYKFEGCYNIGIIEGKDETAKLGIWLGNLFSTAGPLGGEIKKEQISILHSYYKKSVEYVGQAIGSNWQSGGSINEPISEINGATEITNEILISGEMAWALRDYGYGLELPNENKVYPTLQCFDEDLPAVYQLKYTYNDTEKTQYYNPGQTTIALPDLGNGLGWFDQDGIEYKSVFEMPAKDLVLKAETGYSITINDKIEHGIIGIEPQQTLYKAETPITIMVKADEGYQLKSLECKTADNDVTVADNNNGTYSFTMPAADVTISATFDLIQYQVMIADDIQHGNVVANQQTAAAGSVINLTVAPETGYQINELYYKVESSEDAVPISNNSFKMPAANVTVYATFEAIKYQVSIADDIENGTVTASPTEATLGETITLTVTPDNGYQLDKLYYIATGTTTEVPITGSSFTMPAANVTVYASFAEKGEPSEPVNPPVDPINYYNIYDETTYDFIDVSFSRNVVREGGSVNVHLEIPEGLDPAAVTLMYKRGMYGTWGALNLNDDNQYQINNIWTDIYVKAVVDESFIDPNPDENHIYIDLSETNDSIWLYTDHQLVEEGKTAVIQAEVAKSCRNKEIRYMYKRTVLGEWKEMSKDYSINQYVVRDITTDIYVKAYFVFDKQDPTTAKNPHHVYADITATSEGLYLDATRHKVADEGDTKVFLYVKKGFETKDARYQFKRGLKGEWEDLVPGIEQNTFQVTDIEGDIYLKGIDAVYTGTEDINGVVRVYTKDGSLFVYTAQPEEISVVSMTGVTVKRTRQTGLQSYPLNQGIYVVCVGEQVFKVRVK